MNQLASPAKDSNARRVATLPHWAQGLKNHDEVGLDTYDVAHSLTSLCWKKRGAFRMSTTTLVIAMVHKRLCVSCRLPKQSGGNRRG